MIFKTNLNFVEYQSLFLNINIPQCKTQRQYQLGCILFKLRNFGIFYKGNIKVAEIIDYNKGTRNQL